MTGRAMFASWKTRWRARLRSILAPKLFSEFVAYWSRATRSSFHPGEGAVGRELTAETETALKEDLSWIRTPHELHLGAWLVAGNDDVFLDVPRVIAYNFQDLNVNSQGSAWKASCYVDDKWALSSKWTVGAGLRADYVAKSKETALAPRLNLAYAWNDHMSVLFDYGWFYQSPKAYELGDNPDLKSKKAESYGIGIRHQVGDKVVVNLEAYNKKLARIVTIDSLGRFSNLELLNAYNRKNVVHYMWSENYSSRERFTIFPFFASVGL
jgi:outer membrane receptor protein involved in Fe transport